MAVSHNKRCQNKGSKNANKNRSYKFFTLLELKRILSWQLRKIPLFRNFVPLEIKKAKLSA